jgi:hypothetical protein
MTPLLTDRIEIGLAGVLSCYDRIVITGGLLFRRSFGTVDDAGASSSADPDLAA